MADARRGSAFDPCLFLLKKIFHPNPPFYITRCIYYKRYLIEAT